MVKDSRLDLGRYVNYTKDPFIKQRKLNFDDLFASKASGGQYPWNPSRFTQDDLTRKMMTRKLQLNPSLNFIGDNPDSYEVFASLGRFKRKDNYDFKEGRALTSQRPQEQPGFSPIWHEAYQISPTLNPDKRAKNPMPRMSNPDPHGYIMDRALSDVNSENQGDESVASLLANNKNPKKSKEPVSEQTKNTLPLEPKK